MKKNNILTELIVGIILFGVILQIICLIVSSDYLYNSVGLWCGVALAIFMAIHMKRLETIKTRMNTILAENTGKSVEEVTAACERDNFMTAQEANEFGIIDRVIAHHG